MSYLPVTLIIGLTASLIVALVFNPTLCAYLMTPPDPPSELKLSEESEGRVSEVRYRRLLRWAGSITPVTDMGGSKRWFLRATGP